ncbi:FAD-dependent oxidoreductase [Christiangramia sp.]|uniref:FAD-dependent oxidoreductase n=1 Tax=Christiangramia sp. TaxID=1931228 RepID=UPI002631C57C|nr:FAD-dependent oxidoreductase [Christiangramia sp.]
MKQQSIWKSFSSSKLFPSLEEDLKVDVAIIGGGITGISAAEMLHKNGLSVTVLEARRIGKGSTGQSTGNLYAITDQLLHNLESKYDKDKLKKIVESRQAAMDKIKSNVMEYDLDCDYGFQQMFLFQNGGSSKIDAERNTWGNLEMKFGEISEINFPFKFSAGIRLAEQAQLNPLLYVQQLAQNINIDASFIFENSPVQKIEEQNDEVVLYCNGKKVIAKYVVHATHTPKGLNIQYDTTLGPYREYGIAAKLENEDYPQGIFWGYFSDSKFSIRSYKRGNTKYLLCVGQPHKVGQAKSNQDHVEGLIEFLRKNFEIKEVTHVWGGQNYKPADLLPYIGRQSSGSNQFVATGFSTDGLVYGTLAAMIISNEISGEKDDYYEIFKASRHQPLKSAKKFIQENLNVGKQFLKDLPFLLKKEGKELLPDEGMVTKKDGQRIAVYRNRDGEYKVHSAVCPHFGCVVHWNNVEKSWDCPCHGSRFDVCGKVIEGPSLEGLEEVN